MSAEGKEWKEDERKEERENEKKTVDETRERK